MSKTISILGGGESGVGAAVLAMQKDYNVFLSDSNLIKSNYKKILNDYNIDFEEGIHSIDKILESDLIVKSPGIPNKSNLINEILFNENEKIENLDKKIKIDSNLSNRYIDLDPNGYFIIKVDLEENKIILEHFLNKIDDEGYALDPETNEPIKCDSQNKRVSNEVFKGISAKQLGILITEERNDLITRFDHALYLGRELQKAEECLYKKLPYIQD